MIRVLVVDDQPLVRGGIVMLLTGAADIEVAGEASDGLEAVDLAASLRPHVVLMDLHMPGLDGTEATRRITHGQSHTHGHDRADPRPRVLALTTFGDTAAVYGALRAGASGYLLKDQAPTHLADAIRAVAGGLSWLDAGITQSVIDALHVVPWLGDSRDDLIARLTERVREVLGLLATGLNHGEIAGRLVVSEATARTHISRILMKTGVRDRTQAVVLAYQSGLVRPVPA